MISPNSYPVRNVENTFFLSNLRNNLSEFRVSTYPCWNNLIPYKCTEAHSNIKILPDNPD